MSVLVVVQVVVQVLGLVQYCSSTSGSATVSASAMAREAMALLLVAVPFEVHFVAQMLVVVVG